MKSNYIAESLSAGKKKKKKKEEEEENEYLCPLYTRTSVNWFQFLFDGSDIVIESWQGTGYTDTARTIRTLPW